jgi:RNA polymerase sigma-70 factor (ECF subfamily)
MTSARQAEDPALVDFCREIHPRLVGALTLYCGSRAVAEELTQEALVRVWNRWDTVRHLDAPRGWTHAVAFNLARSWFRRRAAEHRANARAGAAPAAAPEGLDPGEVVALRQAVAALPERQRAVLALRFWSGLSVRETATALQCPEGTVKSLTSRAVDALRRGGVAEEVGGV